MKQRIRRRVAVALAGGAAAALITGTTTTAVASAQAFGDLRAAPTRVEEAPAPKLVGKRLRLPAPSGQSKISATAFSTFRSYARLPAGS
ncbi:hypothetical protein AB0I10_05230 [Streptomyces sp. NPDC050636]|uniref:hypothetical protein n=1 Tax=Streptomyces sp. NPDC050636 TaxID=3154510 RepID=UPI0034313DF8